MWGFLHSYNSDGAMDLMFVSGSSITLYQSDRIIPPSWSFAFSFPSVPSVRSAFVADVRWSDLATAAVLCAATSSPRSRGPPFVPLPLPAILLCTTNACVSPWVPATLQINDDTLMDIVYVLFSGGGVGFIRNNGGPPSTWTSTSIYSGAFAISAVAVADVDGDGLKDGLWLFPQSHFAWLGLAWVCPW